MYFFGARKLCGAATDIQMIFAFKTRKNLWQIEGRPRMDHGCVSNNSKDRGKEINKGEKQTHVCHVGVSKKAEGNIDWMLYLLGNEYNQMFFAAIRRIQIDIINEGEVEGCRMCLISCHRLSQPGACILCKFFGFYTNCPTMNFTWSILYGFWSFPTRISFRYLFQNATHVDVQK